MRKTNRKSATTSGWALATVLTLTVFVSLSIQAQTYTKLHDFTGSSDGAAPSGPLTFDTVGNLYGTTNGRAFSLYGTVYKVKNPSGQARVTPLYVFSGGADGAYPAGVVFGPDHALYGSAHGGGQFTCTGDSGNPGCGVVFRLDRPLKPCVSSVCFWTETPIYTFIPGGQDANNPVGVPTFDQSGVLYETTEFGGGGNCNPGCGAAFKLVRSGNAWSESILYSFTHDGINGFRTYAGMVFDQSGNLYGTNFFGPQTGCPGPSGDLGCGTVYELTPSGNEWTDKTLYPFPADGSNGAHPIAGAIFDKFGNLYGATSDGGPDGGGMVFELVSSGDNWTYQPLYSFSGTPGQLCGPSDNLTIDTAGNLYGTTFCDGANKLGNVFKLTNTQNGWVYTSLHDFSGSDGANPYGGVVLDNRHHPRNIYGTATVGGMYGKGVVFRITP